MVRVLAQAALAVIAVLPALACAPAKAPATKSAEERLQARDEREEGIGGEGAKGSAGTKPPPAGEAPPPVAGKDYDLVVSFRSVGQGVDRDARARLDAIYDATPALARAHGRWGREGEVDECADLDRMSVADRAAFVARVKSEMKSGKNVDVLEHHACQHDFGVAETRYELVVEFFSPGNGTDGKAEQALDQIAASWPKVQRASYPWGKEGEHNECFNFGTAQDARDDFLHRIKTTVASSTRVRIHQDARCGVR